MDVFSLTARISLDSSEYDRGLKDAESRTSRFADVLKANLATDAIRAGFKGIVSAVKGAASAIGGLVKSSVNAYADYEQMVGGVKKLYGNMGQSLAEYVSEQQKLGKSAEQATADWHKLEEAQNLVLENAKNAYKTSGMSMNQYMETATSFSASLINSLKGDTIAAAQQTDKAMQAISDNFNTFGGDISMIQGAFQGFAKQNYTMLDNLKLGYGGTKTEMERLIEDANKYAASIGEASDLTIDSFSDIVSAIDLIQQKQQIAGTTAREASTTIAGSFMTLKSAWENLVTGFSDPDADLTGLINDVVETAETAFTNVIPVVEKAISGIADFVSKIAPIIAERLPGLVQEVVPAILSALSSLIEAVVNALPDLMQAIADVLPGIIDSIIQTIDKVLPSVLEAAGKIIETLIEGLTRNSQQIVNTVMTLVKALVEGISTYLPMILEAGAQILLQLVEGFVKALPDIIPAITKMMERILEIIIEYAPKLIEAGAELISQLAEGLAKAAPKLVPAIAKAISTIIKAIVKNAPKILKSVGEVIKSVVKEVGKLDGVEGIIGKVALAFGAIKLPMGLLGGVSQLTGGIRAGFGGIGDVLSNFNTKMKGAESAIGGFFSKLKTGVTNGMQNFNSQMEAGNGSVGTFLSSLKGGLSGEFGSLKDKVNGFSDKLSVASKGLLALGGGAVGIMGISDAMTKLGDDTENTGLAIAELGGSVAASSASMIAAFGVPGGIVAAALTGIIGLVKGVADTVNNINAKAAGQAIHDALVTPGGVSLDTINQKYVDTIGTITNGSEQFAAKLSEISSARKPIEDTAFSLGMISNAVTTGAATLDEKLPEIKEKFQSLYNDTKTIMDQEYEAIVYGVTQSMSDSLAELGISVPGVVAQLRGIQTESEQTLDQLNQSFEKLSDAYLNADNAFDKARIGQQLQDVIDKMAAFQHVEVDQSVEKVEQLGNALDLSQYIGEDNALNVSKFSADMEALTAAASEGVKNTNAIADESKATMDDWRAKAEALGQDTSDIDWKSLYGANEDTRNETISAIRNTYQAEANEIQTALVEKIPDIIRNAQEEYANIDDPVEKALTSEAAVVAQALSDYQANTIKPAMEGLEDNFNTAFAGTGEHLETYAQDVMGNVMSGMFEFDNTGNISMASLKMNSDWESVFNNVAATIPQYTGKVTEALEDIPEQAHGFGLGTIGGYDGGVSEGISSSTAPGELQNFEDTLVKSMEDGSLDFHSPSHTMHDFGVNTIVGFNEGLEEMVDTTPTIMEEWINKIADTVSNTLETLIDGFKDVGKNISEGIENGLEKAKENLKKAIVKPIKDALKNIEKQYTNYKTAGQKIIDNLKAGFTSKINDLVTKAKEIADKIGKTFKEKKWEEIGKFITEGIKKGIESGKSKVIEAAVDMAVKAYEAAKEVLEIASPSKKMKELGKWLAYGLAEGIAENEDEAINESEEMASKVLSEAQRILDGYKDFHAVGLKDEIYYWKQVKAQLQEGTEAYATTLKTIAELKAQLGEKKFSVSSLEVNYGEYNYSGFMADSLNDLLEYKKTLKKNGLTRPERDSSIVSAAQQRLENFKVFNDMTADEERQFWELILSYLKEGSQAWYDVSEKVINLNEQVAEENRKAEEEAAADREEAAKSALDAVTKYYEKRQEADKKFHEDMDKAQSDYDKKRADTEKKYNDKLVKLDDKYAEDRLEIEKKLSKDIINTRKKEEEDTKKIVESYIENRKNSIMSMTGLLDRTSFSKTWNADYMLDTLQSQVDALNDWDAQLKTLEGRLGADNPMLKVFEDMGVSELYNLKEINSMSDSELQRYSDLYAQKQKVAEERAKQETRVLREDTAKQIEETHRAADEAVKILEETAREDFAKLKETHEKSRTEIITSMNEDLLALASTLQEQISKATETANASIQSIDETLTTGMSDLADTVREKGKSVGEAIIDGIKEGIQENGGSVDYELNNILGEKFLNEMALADLAERVESLTDIAPTFDLQEEVNVKEVFNPKKIKPILRAGEGKGSIVQNVTINSPTPLSPYETTRQMKIANQKLVLAMGRL